MVLNYPHSNGEPHTSTHSYSRLWTRLNREALNGGPAASSGGQRETIKMVAGLGSTRGSSKRR